MLDALGGRYRVSRRVEHFSFDGDELCGDESSVRAFANNDVVMLENVRCSGAAHGQCKRGCTIFWRESWLRPTTANSPPAEPGDRQALAQRLQTRQTGETERYFCQSSELLTATHPLSWRERIRRCLRNVTSGNYGAAEMLRNVFVWIAVRGREKLLGAYPRGTLQKTPVEALHLEAGELVEVKSLDEIKRTLDRHGLNRGLHFAPEMIPYCGRRLRVAARADFMIVEGTGTVRRMQNTVILENSLCDSATWAFGACPREDHIYWREIWLRRVDEQKTSEPARG
ncbi:MAG: hypothetical protein AB7O38_28485, partial [Pirellulaceae bacterium]